MNIDDMTIGDFRKISALLSGCGTEKKAAHPFVGKYVIARCYAAGVHAGELVECDGENVILKDSRRLWSWKANDGIALSGVAQCGLKSGSKVDKKNPLIFLTGVCELIPVATGVKETINGA